MYIKVIRIISAVTIFIFILTGCSEYALNTDVSLSTGELASPEQLRKISESLDADGTSDGEPPVRTGEETVFYWTGSGSKLHLYKDCGHLINSTEIFSGSASEAAEKRKTELCASCLKRSGLTEADFSLQTTIKETQADTSVVSATEETVVSENTEETTAEKPDINSGTVLYWTKSGSKLHIFRGCRYLTNSTNVLSGTISVALDSKKTEPCSACLEDAGITAEEFALAIAASEK